ncbi:TPA: hypothetical protein N0F65_010381 [Lagenidium giganteum]|uniref:RRM domain-containing protein n=1 Tax=Lagenidium giganteum TaxID=4803 RepID=A0AAV2YLE4_9STRA|nr:TPA: hypothetical protein N0F65_010381 [Lagenidium giganteum]
MATVPKHVRLGQMADARDDISAQRSSVTVSPSLRRRSSDAQRIRSFTTEDLPSTTKPLLPPKNATKAKDNSTQMKLRQASINAQAVAKLSTVLIDKVKKSFSLDESERILRANWTFVEFEEGQLQTLKTTVNDLEHAFQFSKASKLVSLATSTLERCDSLVERGTVHVEQCNMMFSHWSNETMTLRDYLSKLCEAVRPNSPPRDQNEAKRNARRAEWAISRMGQSVQSMVSEIRDNLAELDDMITECTKLMVQAITLLHLRSRSADFSGTGVAAGAAGVVAGALVGAAGLIAAPVTGGLSVPIAVAGKGLFFTGVAALTPSTIMLKRHNQQLHGLIKLVECLKCRLEIMNQRRDEMAKAFAACEDIELNVKQVSYFCQDSVELEISQYESAWCFVEVIQARLTTMDQTISLFLASPSIFHYSKSEDSLHHYLLQDDDEEELKQRVARPPSMDLYGDLPMDDSAAGDAKPSSSTSNNNNSTSSVHALVRPAIRAEEEESGFSQGRREATKRACAIDCHLGIYLGVWLCWESAADIVGPQSTSMLPASLAGPKAKSLNGPLPGAKKPVTGFSMAFVPVSVNRKPVVTSQPAQSEKTSTTQQGARPAPGSAPSPVAVETSNLHFFQGTYRDEYDPSRPNSYEAFCEERANREKMEMVKRGLEKRQRVQEIEAKREREKLVKDLEAGKAPVLPTAGRGRGMTMPAWMRKKIEETAAAAGKGTDSSEATKGTNTEQFEDAPARSGLGFAASQRDEKAPRSGLGFSQSVGAPGSFAPMNFTKASTDSSSVMGTQHASIGAERDEFGREITRRNSDHSRKRSRSRSPSRSPDRRRHRDSSHSSTREREHDRAHGHDSGDSRERTETAKYNRYARYDERTGATSTTTERAAPRTAEVTKASKVILLQNMVGPGEVDDGLQGEVKEECSAKYGEVTNCLIYELTGRVNPEEAVRIFVEFKHQQDADKAIAGLNARFFGGRRVKASHYDESKFKRFNLTA